MDLDVAVNGIPLIALIMALVTWISDLVGAQGKIKMAIAMVVGIVLGVAYQLSVHVPATFGEWFFVVIYGLALGLFASGAWDVLKSAARSAVK